MIDTIYTWFVQIVGIKGGAMALVAMWRPGVSAVVADGAITGDTLMQLVVKVGWPIHLHQNRRSE
jgi:hypothetical protein